VNHAKANASVSSEKVVASSESGTEAESEATVDANASASAGTEAKLRGAKFPVASPEACALLEKAIITNPGAKCTHIIISTNVDACDCYVSLPGYQYSEPNWLYDPFAPNIPADPDTPAVGGFPTMPPPASKNPGIPFLPLTRINPPCPFAATCGDNFDCVGVDSWGFSTVQKGKWNAAMGPQGLNTMNCFYLTAPGGEFKVPKKIEAFWYLQQKRGQVQDFYMNEAISVQCTDETTTDPHYVFCEDYVLYLGFSCEIRWQDLFQGNCIAAPAPPSFTGLSPLGEICPMECGFINGELHWPYPSVLARSRYKDRLAVEAMPWGN